jgi:hypothetical protein
MQNSHRRRPSRPDRLPQGIVATGSTATAASTSQQGETNAKALWTCRNKSRLPKVIVATTPSLIIIIIVIAAQATTRKPRITDRAPADLNAVHVQPMESVNKAEDLQYGALKRG